MAAAQSYYQKPPQTASLAITTTSVSSGLSGSAYSTSLQATGGTPSYYWWVSSGQLPAGLALTGTGVLAGTPTAAGTFQFTASVQDSASPAHWKSATYSLAVATSKSGTSALSVSSGALSSGVNGTAYAASLRASGGTPAYTWSIASGSLPKGLTLSATTGLISGTPSASGTSSFTVTVTDNSNPAQTQSAQDSITISSPQVASTGPGATWYIRADGGTRYSANATAGQCDGLADAPYSGVGVNQHCAFNDYRFLWDDQHSYGVIKWVISGGDTIILDNTKQWRVGFDQGASPNDAWCYGGGGTYSCTNPSIPAGTPSQHTRILGRNYASCNVGNAPDKSKMTQVFGGYGVYAALNLAGAQYVDVQCIEITRHSQCTTHGSPSYPAACNRSGPIDDYDSDGITTDLGTHDLLLQDLWIHGHTDRGIIGPIGGVVTGNRLDIDTNGMAGWDFDNGSGTASVNATLNFNNSTIEWSGCNQEYPAVHTIPVASCFSQSSGGYGDGIGTPAGMGMNVYMDHDVFRYNTQDGEDFGHIDTGSSTLHITNSLSYANNGGQFKWGPNFSSVLFENNIALANCLRMSQPIAGTPSNFNAHLYDFCRANDAISFNFRQGSNALFANNTVVSYAPTTFDLKCVDASCSNTVFTLKNNIIRAYDNPTTWNMGSQYGGPGGYCGAGCNDSTAQIGWIIRDHNMYYGLRGSCIANVLSYALNGSATNESCADPLFVGEPHSFTTEGALDNYDFDLSTGSPAADAGSAISGLLVDFLGVARPASPSIGAIEYTNGH